MSENENNVKNFLPDEYMPDSVPENLPEHLGTAVEQIVQAQRQQIHTSEARLQAILETCGAAIAFADHQGQFSYVNSMFKEMLGYSDDEILGKHFDTIIVAEQKRKAADFLTIAQALTGEIDRLICPFRTKNGRTVWGDVHISVLPGANADETQVITVIIDTTAQRQLVEQLNIAKNVAEEANKAKSHFLATMSHEIRTPLNGVIGMSDLLKDTPLQPKQLEYVQLIKTSGESLLSLINDILDFSKIEAGKLDLEATEFTVHEVVESVLQILASKADEQNLELVATFDTRVPGPMLGDPGRLRQILINLVGNSLKFTKQGGVRIHVALDEILDNHVRLKFSVTDTGMGIPKDRQDRLFQPFSQVDVSSTRLFGGTGLGLAICKRLVEKMDGEIHVVSSEGKGAMFSFTAKFQCGPLVLRCLSARTPPCIVERRDFCRGIPPQRCARSGREVAFLQRVAELQGLNTLLVGAGKIKIPALAKQMADWGMAVATVMDEEEAWTRLKEADASGQHFRLVVIDFLPHDPAPENFVRSIQDDPRLRDTAIICLTPLAEDLQQKTWKYPNKIRYVSKPVGGSVLLDCVVRSFFVLPNLVVDSKPLEVISSAEHAPRILVAEDNLINRLVISEMLSHAGITPTLVENGQQAIEQVQHSEFDVVLMDCQMPVMDGYRATEEIRQWEKLVERPRRLPVIALTANAMSDDEFKCLNAGMDAYCSKPIDKEKLMKLIHVWMGKMGIDKNLKAGDNQQVTSPLPSLRNTES